MKVIVIGAGVGGATASLALLRRDFDVELYEQAPKLLPLGAGLSLWGNAITCLDELGVGDAVVAAGTIVETAEIRARSGRVLSRADMRPLADKLGRPTVAVRRGVLHEILVSALPDGVLRLGHELESFSQDHNKVRVRFKNGVEAAGDVLVGADGLRSKVRQAVLADGAPTYSGYRGWLGLVPFNSPFLPPGAVIESWGRGERFGALHCGAARCTGSPQRIERSRSQTSGLQESTTCSISCGAGTSPSPDSSKRPTKLASWSSHSGIATRSESGGPAA